MNQLVHTSTACNRLHDLSDSMRRDTRLWPSHNLCTALKLKYKKFKINKWNIRTKNIHISLVSTLLWDRAALDSHMLPLVAQTKSCHLHSRQIVLRRQRWRVKFHAGRGKGYTHLPCARIGLIDITITCLCHRSSLPTNHQLGRKRRVRNKYSDQQGAALNTWFWHSTNLMKQQSEPKTYGRIISVRLYRVTCERYLTNSLRVSSILESALRQKKIYSH